MTAIFFSESTNQSSDVKKHTNWLLITDWYNFDIWLTYEISLYWYLLIELFYTNLTGFLKECWAITHHMHTAEILWSTDRSSWSKILWCLHLPIFEFFPGTIKINKKNKQNSILCSASWLCYPDHRKVNGENQTGTQTIRSYVVITSFALKDKLVTIYPSWQSVFSTLINSVTEISMGPFLSYHKYLLCLHVRFPWHPHLPVIHLHFFQKFYKTWNEK